MSPYIMGVFNSPQKIHSYKVKAVIFYQIGVVYKCFFFCRRDMFVKN